MSNRTLCEIVSDDKFHDKHFSRLLCMDNQSDVPVLYKCVTQDHMIGINE